jgi:hypothetical protein
MILAARNVKPDRFLDPQNKLLRQNHRRTIKKNRKNEIFKHRVIENTTFAAK